jgi:hypothetical protein
MGTNTSSAFMKLANESSGRFAVVVVAKAGGSVGVDARTDCRARLPRARTGRNGNAGDADDERRA